MIRALGALRDPGTIPMLVHVLEHGASSGERGMAHGALRATTGLALPRVPAAWKGWYEGEQRWFEQEGTAAIADLSSESEAEVVAAVRRLSARCLPRDRIALELAPLLTDHPSPGVRAQVCLALVRLGSDVVAPELTRALEDEDPGVRRHAQTALLAIAGATPSQP